MKDLDQYFEKAARQEEIVSLAEIAEMLSRPEQNVQNHPTNPWYAIFHRKETVFAALAIFAVLLGSIVVFLGVPDRSRVDQEVFVPQTQRRVMHLVSSISASPKNEKITVSQFGTDTSPDGTTIPIHLRSKFELSEDRLKLLGITFTDTVVKYEANVKGKGYVSFSIEKTISTSVSVDDKQKSGVKEFEFYPWFLSDEDGFQGVQYRFENEPALKMTKSFFYDAIDQLIPIQVNRPGFTKVTFWFSQTPELMDILESAAMISENIKIPDDETADKRNRTIEIEIFPTITRGEVQVIANVLEEQKLEIALLNSAGEILQIPIHQQVLNKGDHRFTMDLSTLGKGLYFVRIKSEPGLTTIHRLFKE